MTTIMMTMIMAPMMMVIMTTVIMAPLMMVIMTTVIMAPLMMTIMTTMQGYITFSILIFAGFYYYVLNVLPGEEVMVL